MPTTLPDPLKTEAVVAHEYADSADATAEQRQAQTQRLLAALQEADTDTEVCSSVQSLTAFARGEGVWQGLAWRQRKRQLVQLQKRTAELYPSFRWYLFDGRRRYSIPLSLFGSQRAALYLGQVYVVLTSQEHLRELGRHFDDLIRAAVVQPPSVGEHLERLLKRGAG